MNTESWRHLREAAAALLAASAALVLVGCQQPAGRMAEHAPRAVIGSRDLPDDSVAAGLQSRAAALFVYPLIDDSDPPRFSTAHLPLLCADHRGPSIDGRSIGEGDPVPAAAFVLQWDMDLVCPYGRVGPLVSGRIEVLVFRDDEHGFDALLRPVSLQVLQPREIL